MNQAPMAIGGRPAACGETLVPHQARDTRPPASTSRGAAARRVSRHRWRTLGVACSLALPLSLIQSAHAELLVSAAAGFDLDDNLPRARRSADREGDAAFSATVNLDRPLYANGYDTLLVGARVDGHKQIHYTGLDHVDAGIEFLAQHKFGLGRGVPTVRAAVLVSRADYDYSVRDGWIYSARFDASARPLERLDVDIHYDFERQRADHGVDIAFLRRNFGFDGDAFSTDSHTLGVGITYDWCPRAVLRVDYSHRFGDLTSTSRIDPEIFGYSSAIAVDEAFGHGRFAYRVDGDTDIYTAAIDWSWSSAWGLELSYSYADTSVADIGYRDHHAAISLSYRY